MLSALLRDAAARLRMAGIDDGLREARLLLAHVLGVEASQLIVAPPETLSPGHKADLEMAISRRIRREPLSHIVGHREFWSLSFEVGPDVLDPRPDSETLIEAVLRRITDCSRPWRILDLGTGSGCLLLSLLHELPNATGLGVDQSARALALAGRNADRLGLGSRCQMVTGDWLNAVGSRFDIVVSNPPYIPLAEIATLAPEVRLYEPLAALDGGMDGLDCYRTIIRGLNWVLVPDALIAFEVGAGQAAAVEALLAESGFTTVERLPDLAGIERCVLATLGKGLN